MPSIPEIKCAFDVMRNNRVSLYHAAEAELAAREGLKAAEYEAELSGKCDGKNAEIRAAQKRQITAGEVLALGKAEAEKRSAQLAYELSAMTVDCIKWMIRAEGMEKWQDRKMPSD